MTEENPEHESLLNFLFYLQFFCESTDIRNYWHDSKFTEIRWFFVKNVSSQSLFVQNTLTTKKDACTKTVTLVGYKLTVSSVSKYCWKLKDVM